MDDHEDDFVDDTILTTDEVPFRLFENPNFEQIPEEFDAVTIYLEGGLKADLNWDRASKKAAEAIQKGYQCFWSLDLGLFDQLKQSLSNQGQFLSLALSLEHFRETLWKQFQGDTVGVSLYRGDADFSKGILWDSQQENNYEEWKIQKGGGGGEDQLKPLFCRDVAVEYLLLLASRLPDTLPVYLFLNASSFTGPLWKELQYFNPERFERFRLAIKNGRLALPSLGWEHPTPKGYCGSRPLPLPQDRVAQIGLCVPPMQFVLQSHYAGIEEALHFLQSIPHKLIGEDQLTSEWDGLDYLIFTPEGLTSEGKRKLQGFCAAGGTAVSTGHLIGLPQECSWANFIKDR
jgi:hypothetical protein